MQNVVQDTPLRSASWTTFFGQARAAQASPLRCEPRTTRDMRKFKNFLGCAENFRTSHVPKNVSDNQNEKLNELIRIKNHRINNSISTELISDDSIYRGISAYWFEDGYKVSKENPPKVNELCSIRIEGNYELEQFKSFWIYFETWDSNQNGVSKKDHINSNRLCYGQIERIVKQESNYIDCRFRVNHFLSLINEIKPKPISENWKSIIIDFAKTDFTGSLLTVYKFDKYLNASCQTDGGPYYNFIFEFGDQMGAVAICPLF